MHVCMHEYCTINKYFQGNTENDIIELNDIAENVIGGLTQEMGNDQQKKNKLSRRKRNKKREEVYTTRMFGYYIKQMKITFNAFSG